jgi:hypothetical protein
MSNDVPTVLAALFRAIDDPEEADRSNFGNEVSEDLEAEGETLPDDAEPDENTGVFDVSQLQKFLQEALKGVTNETGKEYKRFFTISRPSFCLTDFEYPD